MTDIAAFLLAASGLLAVVLCLLVRPLLSRHPDAVRRPDPREAAIDVLRAELRELEASRDRGELDAHGFGQAQHELKRRLLDEAGAAPGTATPATSGSSRLTALFLAILLPLAAAGGYALLGTPQALDPHPRLAGAGASEMDAMVERLAGRLDAHPDDPRGWIMLARSYKALGRFAESAQAFGRAGSALDDEPLLLAEYAEVLVRHRGTFSGKPDELISRALALAPDEPQVLFLAGAAANERGDFSAMADFWGRLLPQLEPGSDDARAIEAAIDEARKKAAGPR